MAIKCGNKNQYDSADKEESITLKQPGSLAGIPKHPQRKLYQLLGAEIHLVWFEDENDQEHQQDEPDLSFYSDNNTQNNGKGV